MRLSAAAVFLLAPLAFSQRSFQPKPIAPKEFAVMAWGDSPSDTEQLRGMKDAGLNISGFCRAEDLDRVKAAGLTCFVNDPKLSAYAPEPPGAQSIRRDVVALKKQIGDNPAALGFFLRDEPSASLMPLLGNIAENYEEDKVGVEGDTGNGRNEAEKQSTHDHHDWVRRPQFSGKESEDDDEKK